MQAEVLIDPNPSEFLELARGSVLHGDFYLSLHNNTQLGFFLVMLIYDRLTRLIDSLLEEERELL